MVAGIEGIFLFLDRLIGSGVHDLVELIRNEAFIEIRKELGIAERFLTEEIKNRRVERYMILFRKDGETARDDTFQPLISFQRLFFHLGRNGIEDVIEMIHFLYPISRIQIRREEGLVADRTPRVCLFSKEGREGSLDLMDAFEHMKERRVVFRIVLQDILGDVEAKDDVVGKEGAPVVPITVVHQDLLLLHEFSEDHVKSVASLRLAGIGKKRPPAESDAHTGEVL